MRIIVVAVGRLRPPYTDDVQHYQRLLARHARVELIEVREDERVARRLPERAFVSLLDSAGERLVHVKLDRVSPLAVPVLVMIGRESLPQGAVDDELLLAVPASHEWADAGVIAAEKLTGASFIIRELGSGSRHVVEAGLQQAGVRLNSLRIVMELDSTEAILSCIEAGLGVGIVSKWALDRRLQARTIAAVRIQGHPFARTFSFVLAHGPFVQPQAETLIRFLQAAVPALPKVPSPELRASKPPAAKPVRKNSDKNRSSSIRIS